MNFRAKIESLENELGKLKTERMSYYVERRQLERKLEVKNDELEDLKRELGFSKDAEAKAIKRYKRALEYNIEVEAEVAELNTRLEQETGQLLGRLIHFKEKLAERELELRNLGGKTTAACRELEADLASRRQVNDVKCSLKSRKRKEFAKPRAFSERKLVGENGVVCDRKRKFPAYIQKTETGDVSSTDASNHNDDTFTDASDHEQDAEQTYIQIFLEFCGKLIAMRVEPSLTIDDLKFKILNKVGIQYDLQRLLFAGKRLVDGRTLAHYNIKNKSIIQLLVELIGD